MPLDLLLIRIFAIIGILDSSYLAYHRIRNTDPACPFLPKEWCRMVRDSPQSKTFGIPNSFAGIAIYTVLLVLDQLFSLGLVPFWPIQALIAFGFLFSLYFFYIQAFVLEAFCAWCLLSAINFIVLVGAAFIL